MNGDQLLSILEGMERNQLLDEIQYVLTGYIGSASFLNAIRSLVLKIKSDKPQFRYICDPVLGDDGRLYVPKELVKLFRTQIIPIADICTPNQYEVEQLTGINIGTLQDAKRACAHFHNMGPSIVFLTSLEIPVDQKYNNAGWEGEWITVFASQRKMLDKMSQDEYYRIDCPKIPGSFTGTGDLTTA
jgi:pyridoxine kinase